MSLRSAIPRVVSALAAAGLITVLEVILAPFWVWLAFAENPGLRALIGGAVVLAAVIGHTLVEKRAMEAAAE